MEKKIEKSLRSLLSILALVIISVATQLFIQDDGLSQSYGDDSDVLMEEKDLGNGEELTVWIFDIGQGDAIFIDGPEKQVLIDGGPNAGILEKLSAVMPFWDKDIDIIINTHPHADHVTGLVHVLERYDIGEVFDSGQFYKSNIFHTFDDMTDAKKATTDMDFDLGAGAVLHIVYPAKNEGDFEDVNEGSVVAMLEYGETTVLLTGDISVVQERELKDSLPHIDVLKVAHQGSRTSSDMMFLESISPDYAVIPVGENSYGHPHKEVLTRLNTVGATVLRTDQFGDVRILSRGGEPEVKGFDL